LLLVGGAVRAADAPALPDGSGEAFYRRMMDWSAPAPEPAAQPLAAVQADTAAAAPRDAAVAPRPALPYLSSRYGIRADPFGGGERMHGGIDIPGSLGSPILAADGGVVTFAGRDGGYGLMIELDHGNGLRTRYGHLSRILVSPGTAVSREQVIALMGSTGRSTGSHLHFEVLANGRRTDPVAFLGAAPPAHRFVPHPAAPHPVREAVPAHVSRFAQARDGRAEADDKRPRQR
jgi:murein DD-endopeptidase MepM/ murein hydrolase activator NlpD